jgi:hypothetical protein
MFILGIISAISILGMVSILVDLFLIKEKANISHNKPIVKNIRSYATVILDNNDDSLS